jgi:hypothetical protein
MHWNKKKFWYVCKINFTIWIENQLIDISNPPFMHVKNKQFYLGEHFSKNNVLFLVLMNIHN